MVVAQSTTATKTCTKCGETKPETEFVWNKNKQAQKSYRRPDCKACNSKRGREFYAANAESINQRVRAKRRANHAASRAKERKWEQTYKDNHPEEYKAYQKAYRLANKEKSKTYHRAHYARNVEKERAYYRAYHANNLEKRHEQLSASQKRRRAQKYAAPRNDLTAAQWMAIKDHYGHRCVYCGRKMQRLTQDHIIPLSKGGSHTLQNVAPACKSCNSRKHDGPVLKPVQPLLLI